MTQCHQTACLSIGLVNGRECFAVLIGIKTFVLSTTLLPLYRAAKFTNIKQPVILLGQDMLPTKWPNVPFSL